MAFAPLPTQLEDPDRVARAPRGPARHAVALLVFVALALVALGPALWAPTTRAVGHPGNDVWNHVWGFWYVADALGQGRLPVSSPLLAWPRGGSLWFIDTFNAVLTLPVQALFGPVAAYNASVAGNLALCGVGAYALALRVSRSWGGALFAGVAYLTAPHLLGQVYNGISETVAAGWLPLAILGVLVAARDPRPRTAALAGLVFGINGVANWYYGLFAGIVLLGLLARGALSLHGRARPWGVVRDWVLPVAIGGAVTAAVVAGPFWLFLQSMSAADAIVTRDPGFVLRTLVEHNMTDLVSLLRPGRVYSPDLKEAFDEDLIVVVYLGWSLMVPAALALAGPLRRRAAPWAAMAGAFTLLALGPYLYLGGAYRTVGDQWIPLPFLWLFEAIPLFGRISHAYRFAVGVTLALAVMAALAVAAAGARRVAVPAVAALCVARAVESLWLSPAVTPMPWSDARVAPALATLEGGAVLDLPVTLPVLQRSKYILGQLEHGQPVPFGLNDPLPPWLAANRYTRFLVGLERTRVSALPTGLPWFDLVAGRAGARAAGLRWIVVHKADYAAPERAKITRFLDVTATPVHDDAALRIYRLDDPPGSAGDPAPGGALDPEARQPG